MSDHLHVVCPHCDAVNRLPAARLDERPTCGQCRNALFTGQPLELTASNFDRHVKRSDLPVVVDFWAPWCAPCRSMAPAFASAASELEPGIRLAKVDTESQQQLATRFTIRSIPTLAIFSSGREIIRQSGAIDAPALQRWIRAHL
ncbi:MAG TPA: thioredoxin TrxC [Azonexus sp.]|jgi:thioredoxin 2|uniref:Thioredoxin n=1 Tax=Candidatus Dechloromonas phosphorivorans TaxID=2899244 RepID=A0A9D7LQR7_9RHOO|nr:thioredoxin TrxC [Candidatus Dechloromonas phosphorivorans]HRH14751.1 thioredoxin TrxC [Azonexus sp.]